MVKSSLNKGSDQGSGRGQPQGQGGDRKSVQLEDVWSQVNEVFEAVEIDGGGVGAQGGCLHCPQVLSMLRGESGFKFDFWITEIGFLQLDQGMLQIIM